jgi:hypothetical protein
MPGFLEVSAEQIYSLGSEHLIELLRRLLLAEARRSGIAARGVVVPAQITIADDGEDGSIEWSNGPDSTEYLPKRRCLFQSKACTMGPEACGREVTNKDGSLKQAIVDCLTADGAYLFFCSQKCTKKMLKERIEKIREGISRATANSYPDATIDFYDANRIAAWCNAHPAVVVWVVEQTTGVRLTQLRTWSKWALEEDLAAVRFVAGAPLADRIGQLRSHLSRHRSVARILGMSGLGKTRLAFETFRPNEANAVEEALAATVLYASADVDASAVLNHAEALCDAGAEVVLVVDDCSSRIHAKLRQIVRRVDSNLSLLTLDYDLEGSANEEHVMRMEPATDEVIKGIVEQTCPGLLDADVSRVVDFAQGFPQVAVLLGRARLQGAQDLGALSDSDLADRMVSGRRGASDTARNVLRVCAMFDVLGIEGRVKEQMEFAATHVCRIDHHEFYGVVQDFIERGVIQKRGDFIQVQPKPLAIRLAAEKWKRIPPDEARELFQKHMPAGLTEALCDQLAKLDFLREARDVAGRLCERTGPFGRLEVLNTESGSRCFRSITEANPEAAMATLVRELGPLSEVDLRRVGPGRRNLVWALEKLAFRRETFENAARLLLSLAVAETESWDNNATGEFISKFQMYLSGTEATPDLKYRVLDGVLASGDSERGCVAVKALGTALQTVSFSRSGGAEAQGSGAVLQDWKPATYGEARDYLRAALDRLTRVACSESRLAPLAKAEIATHLRGVISKGIVDEVDEAIDLITARDGRYWPQALESVSASLEYDGEGMPAEYRGRVENIRARLMPASLEERLRFFISDLPWGLYIGKEGETRERERLARELAREVAAQEEILYKRLPDLLRGEQRQGYEFGHEIGQVLRDPQVFIDRAISILREIPRAESNPVLLGGFLAGLEGSNRGLVDATLDRLATDEAEAPDLAQMTSFVRIQAQDLERVSARIRSGRQPIAPVVVLAYGSVLNHLRAADVQKLLDVLVEVGGKALWVALEIGMMYAHQSPERFRAIRSTLRTIVLADGLLAAKIQAQTSEYHLQHAIESLVRSEGGDAEVAVHFAQELVRIGSRAESSKWLHFWENVLPVLLQTHRDAVWTVFAEALKTDRAGALDSILSGRFSARSDGGVLGALDPEFILRWCRANPEVGPQFVLKNASLLESGSSKNWNEIVLSVLDEFGDRDEVLDALGVAMASFSWSGSLVPYYERYVEPLRFLQQGHSRAKVRKWAESQLGRVQKAIEREQKRDDEREFGLF